MIRMMLAAALVALAIALCVTAAGAEQPTERVLAAMLALPQYVGDRDDNPDKRSELYRPLAQTIAAEARGNRSKEAALVTLAWLESRLARYVLEGRCKEGPRGMRCDAHPRTGVPRARGAFQVWGWCRDAWRHPEGSIESMRAEARCASRMLSAGLQRCRGRHPAGDWAGAFSGYRNGACTWAPAAARARRMETVLARLGS